MAINKNHEFEDLEGIKCAIVEKNALKERVDFLKEVLACNGYTVIVVASPPPKTVPVAASAAPGEEVPVLPVPAETFTVAVTNVMFNATNAIFGRLLHTPGGHTVTLAYWQQKEPEANDEIPYFENGNR